MTDDDREEPVAAQPSGKPEGLTALQALLEAQGGRDPAPVERWSPPYCGDIGMRIRGDGVWMYQGSPIGRMPLVKLFARVLRKDADGRTYLVTPGEMVDVTVDDAHFLAVEMEVEGRGPAQLLRFRTNVDDVIECGPRHPLRFVEQAGSGGLKPYLGVRGRLEALVTRALYYDLVELSVVAEDGSGPGLWSGGAWFPLAAAPGR